MVLVLADVCFFKLLLVHISSYQLLATANFSFHYCLDGFSLSCCSANRSFNFCFDGFNCSQMLCSFELLASALPVLDFSD